MVKTILEVLLGICLARLFYHLGLFFIEYSAVIYARKEALEEYRQTLHENEALYIEHIWRNRFFCLALSSYAQFDIILDNHTTVSGRIEVMKQ